MAKHKPSLVRTYGTSFRLPPESDPLAETREDLTAEIIDHPAFRQIAEYLAHAKALAMDPADPETIRRAVSAGVRAFEAEQQERIQARSLDVLAGHAGATPTHPSLIYYMRMGNLVKIGTTTWLLRRIQELKPQGVMAVEPGSAEDEKLRHHEFAELREHSEWFRLDARLGQHIARLRERFEERMGVPLETWLNQQEGPGVRRYRQLAAKNPTGLAGLPPVVLNENSDLTLLPASQAARAVGVSPQLFNAWRRAGKVKPAAVTARGRKLYRLTEALAVSRRSTSP